MDLIQDIIGHRFANLALLEEALTHASLSYERQIRKADNQRLEFLGDAVIQLTLSHMLFEQLDRADEGVLTKARAQMVSTRALAQLAAELNLGEFIFMGRGEAANGGRTRESTLADVLEAIAGAVYLDGGLEAATRFTERIFGRALRSVERGDLVESNPKGQLQEHIQAIDSTPPTYAIIEEEGPDHDKWFVAEVRRGDRIIGQGKGRSKKEAETQAAAAAMARPEILREPNDPSKDRE
jgi:ribonuclease-3